MNAVETLDLVDDEGNILGTAARADCHGDPALVHRAVHVLVFNSSGELFLQRRSPDKLIQPGMWDSSVGGHVSSGEDFRSAALRETTEELGISVAADKLRHAFDYRISNEMETEHVRTYVLYWDGPMDLNEDEIMEGRFFGLSELRSRLTDGTFTPSFQTEFELLIA